MTWKFIGAFATGFITLALAIAAGWINNSNRVAVVEIKVQSLEVQIQNDREMFSASQDKADKNMKEIMDNITEIKMKLTSLQDTKANKYAN